MWTKGQSGNRAGRPKGFAGVARMIMQETRDGADLVQWALDVWRDPERSFSERQAAHAWLSDRALGKPLARNELVALAKIEHAPALPPGWDAMTHEQRRAVLDDLERGALRASAAALALPAADEHEGE